MRTIAIVVLTCLALSSAKAQDEPEYRMEIGAGTGMANYEGDLSGNIFGNMQPRGELKAKYRMNPRMALAASIGFGKLKGSAADTDTFYPQPELEHYNFSNSMADVTARFEYNFWPFGTGREYRGAKPLTPFITIGLGATYVNAKKNIVTANLPIGAGIKYKVADRLNLTAEWIMHFTQSDKLDGVEDPYGIKSSGIFKNTDSYSVLALTLTYDIWAKCKTCHNDRD